MATSILRAARQIAHSIGRSVTIIPMPTILPATVLLVSAAMLGQETAPLTGNPSPNRQIRFLDRGGVVDLSELSGQPAGEGGGPERVHSHEFLRIPTGFRVPDAAAPAPYSMRAQEMEIAQPSPSPTTSFRALPDNDTRIPPDTQGAVGPQHLMAVLNSQVRVQNKSGTSLLTLSLDSFWAPLHGDHVFDPKLVFDPHGSRWIFAALDGAKTSSSRLLLAASETADPAGGWVFYSVDADPDDFVWADFPSLGFTADKIAIQTNMYEMCGESACDDEIDNDFDGEIDEFPFNSSDIYVFPKAEVYAGTADTVTVFPDEVLGGTQVPATTYDPSVGTVYLVQDWDGDSRGSGFLRLYAIDGPPGGESLRAVAFPGATATWSDGPLDFKDFAPQRGSSRRIQLNDSRVLSVVYRNGAIWATQTVFLPTGGNPSRSAVQWWQISPTGVVLQAGRVDDPSGTYYYAFPSIAVNRQNDTLIGYSRFAATEFASAAFSFRGAADPAGIFRSGTTLKAGEASYFKTFGGRENRWGDYSATVVDPENDFDLWTIQEYAATQLGGTDRWGTWWGRVTPPASPLAAQFSYSPANPIAGDALQFSDNSTGSVTSWSWSFGDGTSSATQHPTKSYERAGAYLVSLVVSDGNGSSSIEHQVLVVNRCPRTVGVSCKQTPILVGPR